MLRRKVVKLSRWMRWAIPRAGAVPLRWHAGRPNFGDDINPLLFSKLLDRPVYHARKSRPHLLGQGSILDAATGDSCVIGSGLLTPSSFPFRPNQVLALRGELTARATGITPRFLGDPAVLVGRLFAIRKRPAYRLGFVPHYTNVAMRSGVLPEDCLLIDPGWHPLKVLDAINRCEAILSQSMHGLIFADASGVPNAWLEPHASMIGGDFKFRDYYSTTTCRKTALPAAKLKDLTKARSIEYFVSDYRYSLADYQNYLREHVTDWMRSSLGRAGFRAVSQRPGGEWAA